MKYSPTDNLIGTFSLTNGNWDKNPYSIAPEVEKEQSRTQGMTLAERINHVGGVINNDLTVTFGSVMAVNALISHVLRDSNFSGANSVPLSEEEALSMFFLNKEDLPLSKETYYRFPESTLVDIVRRVEKAHGIGV